MEDCKAHSVIIDFLWVLYRENLAPFLHSQVSGFMMQVFKHAVD